MKLTFKVPAEHHPKTLAQLLGRAWPAATDAQIAEAFDAKRVRVDTRVSRNPDKVCAADAQVVAEVDAGGPPVGMPDGAELARGDGWVAVDKSTGMPGKLDRDDPMNPVLYLADALGLDRSTVAPVWSMPAAAGGPWLVATSPERAAELLARWAGGELMITWVVLVPTPGRPQGRIQAAGGIPVDYSATQIRGGITELQLTPRPQAGDVGGEFDRVPDPVKLVLDALADHHIPVLGDAHRGGYMADGGLRLRVTALFQADSDLGHSWTTADDWWPTDPIAEVDEVDQDDETDEQPTSAGADLPRLLVSAKTIEVVADRGHPWVLADPKTGKRAHLQPGTPVQLEGTNGAAGPTALIEGTGKLAARVWSRGSQPAHAFDEEINVRVDEAFVRRAKLTRQTQTTDLFRLIHGQADGLPGFHLDRVGPLLRARLMGASAFGFRDKIYQNILDFDPQMMILEVEHLRDIRTEERPQARVVAQGAGYVSPGTRVVGLEDGLKYWCEPWQGVDVGFFADQRQNRRRARSLAQNGQRWLNLFCHTGAYTVSLVDAGCRVVSVDLSRRYLDWLEDNLDLNELDRAQNTSVAADARDYLDGLGPDDTFDGIIVDPPTAASGEQGFWSVGRDYEALLVDCLAHLAPGGHMLVCRNEKRPADTLDTLVRRAADQAGRGLSAVEPAPPAPDFPTMDAFPEGTSFEGVWVQAG